MLKMRVVDKNKKSKRSNVMICVICAMMLAMRSDGFTALTLRAGRKVIIGSDDKCSVFGTRGNTMMLDSDSERSNMDDSDKKEVMRGVKRKCVVGGLGLALTTGLGLSVGNYKAALAMGPNLAGPSMQTEVTGMELAQKMAQLRLAREMASSKKAADDEGSRVFKEEGSEAYQEFLKECESKRVGDKERKVVEREELIRDLILVQEVDPFKSLKGKALLYMFDHGIDLYKVPGTEQEAFERLKKMFPEKYGDVEARQMEATRTKVQLFRDQGLSDDDIVSRFLTQGTKYAKLGDDRGRDLDNLQTIRDKRRNKNKPSALPALPSTVPSTVSLPQLSQTDSNVQQQKPPQTTLKQADDAKTKAADHKQKAKAEANKRKQLAKEKKSTEKAFKQQEKLQRKAAKAAAKAAATIAAAKAAATIAAISTPSLLPSTDLSHGTGATDSVEQQDTTSLLETSTVEQRMDETADASTPDQTLTTTAATSTPSQEKDNLLVANNYKIPKILAGTTFLGASSYLSLQFYNRRSKESEQERQRQFDLLMGTTTKSSTTSDTATDQTSTDTTPITDTPPTLTRTEPATPSPYANADPNIEVDIQTPQPQFLTKISTSSPQVQPTQADQTTHEKPTQTTSSSSLPTSKDKNKGRGGTIANLFKKNTSDRRPTTLAKVYSSTPHTSFAKTLAQVLTLGAPGRFPDISPPQPPNSSVQTYKNNLVDIKTQSNIPIDQAADIFANSVNCMLIQILDLASATVVNNKNKKKENDKIVVDAVSVVLDFMDFSAQLYEDLFNDHTIAPVTYTGSLSKSKLENLFSTYATAQMTNFESGIANNQDRIDTLQRVFNIPDKRAEGLLQKTLMKNFMSMMKDGDSDGGAMAEMMKGLAGDGASSMLDPSAQQDGEVNPEDIQSSIKLMKELMESGSISKEEISLVKDQFSEVYGTDINKFLQEAEGEEQNLDEDGKELLNLFKDVLKE